MRNLTIRRTKSFVACLGKMKVYIEDPMAGELVINNVRCRKLGVLKNGETKTFSIGDQAAKVFVIADKVSRNFSNDYFQLPEGQEDIFLTGKNKYNPIAGNPFRFDNNTGADVVANRKKGTRIGLIILAVAAVVGFIVGFVAAIGSLAGNSAKPKTFSCDDMQITLTREFITLKEEGFDFACGTEDVVILGLKESFEDYPKLEDYTLRQYGNQVIQNNNLTYSILTTDGDLTYFGYDSTNAEAGETYHYVALSEKLNASLSE